MFHFDLDKLRSVATGALLAGLGAGLTVLAEALTQTDLGGTFGPILAAAVAVAINAVRKAATPPPVV